MRYWGREIVGWLLLLLGLLIFNNCMNFLERGKVTEAVPLSFIGFVVFRGGLHLLKVAAAARICLRAETDAVAGTRRLPGKSSS
jgi:hypothetical protein